MNFAERPIILRLSQKDWEILEFNATLKMIDEGFNINNRIALVNHFIPKVVAEIIQDRINLVRGK